MDDVNSDADFRLPAAPPVGDTDGDLRSLFSSLPPILEPPSLGDLEKLLVTSSLLFFLIFINLNFDFSKDGDDRDTNVKKRNGQNSDGGAVIVDMDLSDDDKDVQLSKFYAFLVQRIF